MEYPMCKAKDCELILKENHFVIYKIPSEVSPDSEIWILWNPIYKVFGNVWTLPKKTEIRNMTLYVTEKGKGCLSLAVNSESELRQTMLTQVLKERDNSCVHIDFGYDGVDMARKNRRIAMFFSLMPSEIREAMQGTQYEKIFHNFISKGSKQHPLIDIEGLDGVGKNTQSKLLEKDLKGSQLLSFPNYNSESSALANMYLNGKFGADPKIINPYTVSTFFAADRAASLPAWKNSVGEKTIITDRYTPSNAIYQAAKLPTTEWESFLLWLEDLEYHKMGIPKPDCIFFLDIPEEVADKLLKTRYNGKDAFDIHEKDRKYQQTCRKVAEYIMQRDNRWINIPCMENGQLLSAEAIHKKIMEHIPVSD